MEITKGRIKKALKFVIYGPEGIGKSTLASRFPDPVFIDTEGSTNHMDVARFPAPSSWQMLLEEVQYVINNPTCCKTLIIDTADWAEKLCTECTCDSRHVKGIEDFGYGKGYTYLKEDFGKLLNMLTEVIEAGINVVLTAHAQMRKFEQPDEMGAYDRWELKLSKQCAPLVKEWADIILFCNYKTIVINVDNQGAVKGKNKAQGSRRVMYTVHHACWDAKNRHGLPEECDMDYGILASIVEGNAGTDTQPAPVENAAVRPVETQAAPKEPVQMDIIDMVKQQATAPPQAQPQPQPQTTPRPPEAQPPTAYPPKEPEPETQLAAEASPVSKYFSDPARLPTELKDLMEQNNICEWHIQDAVTAKHYYPENTLIQDMDPDFVKGWIIAFWPQVVALIKQIESKKEIPFN